MEVRELNINTLAVFTQTTLKFASGAFIDSFRDFLLNPKHVSAIYLDDIGLLLDWAIETICFLRNNWLEWEFFLWTKIEFIHILVLIVAQKQPTNNSSNNINNHFRLTCRWCEVKSLFLSLPIARLAALNTNNFPHSSSWPFVRPQDYQHERRRRHGETTKASSY